MMARERVSTLWLILCSLSENIDALGNLSSKLVNETDYVINEFASIVGKISTSLLKGLISISRSLYVTLFVVGAVLYFTRLNRRLGRDLMLGSVSIAILMEAILPFIV